MERAHALGLELHAWLNPFRITKGGQAEFDSLTADHPAKLHPDWVVEYEGEFYFNPGLPEVREYIIQGAEELARNYDIDGVHLDDYFYPGSGFDDADTYAQYGAGFSDLGDWRRDNVNRLVEELGEAAPRHRPQPVLRHQPLRAYGRTGAACPRAPTPPTGMRATTPPTPTAASG